MIHYAESQLEGLLTLEEAMAGLERAFVERANGAEPVGSSPEEFDAFIKSEIGKWGKVIRDAGVPRAD